MNDHDAMEAINAVLEQWFNNKISAEEALKSVCYISGRNSFEHDLAKRNQP